MKVKKKMQTSLLSISFRLHILRRVARESALALERNLRATQS
jgi:hypothetical protein